MSSISLRTRLGVVALGQVTEEQEAAGALVDGDEGGALNPAGPHLIPNLWRSRDSGEAHVLGERLAGHPGADGKDHVGSFILRHLLLVTRG